MTKTLRAVTVLAFVLTVAVANSARADDDTHATVPAAGASHSKAVTHADRRLDHAAKGVDASAASDEQKVADRMAQRLGTDAKTLLDEKTQYDTGWGNLMIAHLLLAKAPSGTTRSSRCERTGRAGARSRRAWASSSDRW